MTRVLRGKHSLGTVSNDNGETEPLRNARALALQNLECGRPTQNSKIYGFTKAPDS